MEAHKPPTRYHAGQMFNGYAFGEPITVELERVEWINDGREPFWSWHTTNGAMISEEVLTEDFTLIAEKNLTVVVVLKFRTLMDEGVLRSVVAEQLQNGTDLAHEDGGFAVFADGILAVPVEVGVIGAAS